MAVEGDAGQLVKVVVLLGAAVLAVPLFRRLGLEMRPSHLWSLRRQIFGLGTLQIAACTAALTGVGLACAQAHAVRGTEAQAPRAQRHGRRTGRRGRRTARADG